MKSKVCSPDIEHLAVEMWLFYLPREFSHAIAVVVYIPPSANAAMAHAVLQTQYPNALIIISGDFTHAPHSSTLTNFTQYVTYTPPLTVCKCQ